MVNERTQKAFDFAQESVKQFLTLATGLIALSITFSKDFLQRVPEGARHVAVWSWGFYLASVFCGLWTLLALTGTLEDSTVPLSISGKNVTIPAILQVVTFFVALVLTVVFGGLASSRGV